MINITKLLCEHFLTINYYEMKLLFDTNILIDSYYMLICMIILYDMYITILPYK